MTEELIEDRARAIVETALKYKGYNIEQALYHVGMIAARCEAERNAATTKLLELEQVESQRAEVENG